MRHKWAEVIEAYINGKNIQTRRPGLTEAWHDVFTLDQIENVNIHFPNFNDPNAEWRIKPKMKKVRCRLALHKDSSSGRYYAMGYDDVINSGIDGFFLRGEDPRCPTFVRWLTDYIEVEVECNDA